MFCLIHKMDLIPEDQRKMVHSFLLNLLSITSVFALQIFDKREAELMKRSLPLECTCFKTSIWDETLYKASLTFNT